MSQVDIGLWYVMIAAGGMATLIDFGLSSTTIRCVSALYAGATEILVSGHSKGSGAANWPAIASFYRASQLLYGYLSLGVAFLFIIAVVIGAGSKVLDFNFEIWVTIALFCLASVCIVIDSNLSAFLAGIGKIGVANKIIVFSNLIYIIMAASGLIYFGNVLTLGFAGLLHAGVRLMLTKKEIGRLLKDREPSPDPKWNWRRIVVVIWPNTWRYGLACVGAYLIITANTLVISRELGFVEVSSYGLTNQAISAIASISGVFLTAKLPSIIALGVRHEFKERRRLFLNCYYKGCACFIGGCFILIAFGQIALDSIHANAVLLNLAPLLFFAFYRMLEFNHSQFASLVIAGNKMPFLWPALVSGLAIVTLSSVSAEHFGLWGILISTAAIQLACNNWYPVLLGVRVLRIAN